MDVIDFKRFKVAWKMLHALLLHCKKRIMERIVSR